eukprot:gene4539-5136_t
MDSNEESGKDISRLSDYNGKPTSPMHASEPPNSAQPQDGEMPKDQVGLGCPRTFKRPGEYVSEEVVKLSEKVIVPVKEFPKFNYVGKLLGPRGNTLKRLQAQTGTKMSVLGRGSMRDKEKEDELRASEDPKFSHLSEPLHVLIEVEGVQSDAHLRLAGALSEIKKYMTPENDDIRAQQMQEMAYLQSLENPEVIGPPLHAQISPLSQIPITVQSVPRGRARQILRGSPMTITRGGRGMRGGKPVAVARMSVPSRGLARTVVTHRTVVAPRHATAAANHQYDSYDATYDPAYETAYGDSGAEVFYDYSGGETYEYAPTSSANFQQSSTPYKAQPVRHLKRSFREAAYPY